MWFQNRRMKSKKLQARAPNVNGSGSKQDSGNDEAQDGGGGGSRSGCPSTASSLDSGAHQHAPPLPHYNYHTGVPPSLLPFSSATNTSSMKMDTRSPGQHSDGKDSTHNSTHNGYGSPIAHNTNQPPVINPFEPSKLIPSPGVFERRFDMPYNGSLHMPPPPTPFNTPGVSSSNGQPPFQLPHFLHQQQPQGPNHQSTRTLDV